MSYIHTLLLLGADARSSPLRVHTRPYRAPELLFRVDARTYNAFAIEAWSLGDTLAGYSSPLSFWELTKTLRR